MEDVQESTGAPLFFSDSVRISCVGGGPGSDILAVLKYLSESADVEPVKKLTCYLLDGEQAWADTWAELDDSISGDLNLKTIFQPLDVCEPESWAYQKKFLTADLFTLSYFVSEVHHLDNDGAVSHFWATLLDGIKPGALFVRRQWP
ncbi:MAG: hypothetical protein ACR2RB_06330 [Gammaproteobacteria bacterium]